MTKLIADTRGWMPNYRFAYLLVWAALVIAALALVGAAFLRVGALTVGILGVVAAYCAVMVAVMPRWALNAEEEAGRRRRAKAARAELRGEG